MRTATKFNKTLKLIFLFTLGMSISWASAITVQLRDSEGNTLPDGNTATLDYWNGDWTTLATNDGFGNFDVPVSMLPATVKMNYNASSEQRQFTGLELSPVTFATVTFTAIVKNANGDILATPAEAYYNTRQGTWRGSKNAGEFDGNLPRLVIRK